MLTRIATALAAGALLLGLPAQAADIRSSVDEATLAGDKKTVLGLHLTARDAHRALEADPGIVFLDVRDPNEVDFVGHPVPVDAVVPLLLATREFVPEEGSYAMERNEGFVEQVGAVMAREGKAKDDPVFVMCRSGARGAAAVEALAEAGYDNVWNLVHGFQGDAGEDGVRDVNGWRTAGLPWSYHLEPEVAWTPGGG
jgi:rhodanese-related sulfurtransferase